MNRVSFARWFSLALLVSLSGCTGGGATTGDLTARGPFRVLSTQPSDNGQLFLNDSISIDFTAGVDLDSVDLNTFSFQVFNQVGQIVAEPVAGTFRVVASPGDAVDGPRRRLQFVPRLPTDDQFSNGGFRPGRTYRVQLVGGNRVNGTTIRDTGGRALFEPKSFQFTTADGTSPGSLFRNTAAGGPRRKTFEVTPQDAAGVALNKLGGPPVEVRLTFDQPLNPSSTNVPTLVNTNPLTRDKNQKGRVYLEYSYTDTTVVPAEVTKEWIPADAELESNEVDGAVLVLRPMGVLPNNATVRVIVDATLEDISGESNVSNVAYVPTFGTFQTKRSYEQQFDGLVDEFLSSARIDLDAAFSEPVAEVGEGFVRAGFAFEGTTTGVDFDPLPPDTVLNTNFTTVDPANGPAYNVSGGVFNFRSMRIAPNKTVRGQGSNPLVFLVSESVVIEGTLSVRGGDGERVVTSGNASVPKMGGAGVCGGGSGGAGSPSTTMRDAAGETGFGPLQAVGGGGLGGKLPCQASCTRGAGGGGGSFATQGDPEFKIKAIPPGDTTLNNVYTVFQQQTGQGGNGCSGNTGTVTRSEDGAVAGPTVFSDARKDNNFWGVGVRYDTQLRISGELSVPIGGGGGGGGGDQSPNGCDTSDPGFESDATGGGGGGGGGVVIVKCLGPITIADTGSVIADGGHGGGGAPLASSGKGGGGGGGAGGMVILMSAEEIRIYAKGSNNKYRYATGENDYRFSISADGGACITGTTAPVVTSKYPTNQATLTAPVASSWRSTYDSAPLGGYGGLGVVQLMAPPGDYAPGDVNDPNPDGTNTRLDDNIRVFTGVYSTGGGTVLSGAQKQSMLAWRGFADQFGRGQDDLGNEVFPGLTPANNDVDGDIRPAPVLLPSPFAAKSRLRSLWIDTGATARRSIDFDDNLPRGIIDPAPSTLAGPRYTWKGTESDAGATQGYAKYTLQQGSPVQDSPVLIPATGILATNANSTFLGSPAYRVQLTQSVLGPKSDFYVQHEAELLTSQDELIRAFRILAHTGDELVLATDAGALPTNAAKARVRAKFFEIATNGVLGLGPTYLGSGGQRQPIANVRIGFAFHQNPQDPNAARFPADPDNVGTYRYDLSLEAVQDMVRELHAPFVQWDILFDMQYRASASDSPPALNPESPRQELRFLRLPFSF